MARRPVRASLQFDLDHDALIVVEAAIVEGQRLAVINIAPGGKRRGQNVTIYLKPAQALELVSQLEEVANRGA